MAFRLKGRWSELNKVSLRNKGINLTSLNLELSKKAVDEAIRLELEHGLAKDRTEAIKHVSNRAKVQRSKSRNFRIPAEELTLSEAKQKEKINSVSQIIREKNFKKGKALVWKRTVTHPTLGSFRQTTLMKHVGEFYEGKIKLTKVKGGDISVVRFEEKGDGVGGKVLNIHSLKTAPRYQNIGAAKQILSEIKYVAERIGDKKLQLSVLKSSAKNISLYKSLGFKIIGSEDKMVVRMELNLEKKN